MSMASKFWPEGTKLRAKRRIIPHSPPLEVSGVYTSEGKVPMGTITYIEAGSIYQVGKSSTSKPVLERIPKDTDAGSIRLVVWMEDPEDWEAC